MWTPSPAERKRIAKETRIAAKNRGESVKGMRQPIGGLTKNLRPHGVVTFAKPIGSPNGEGGGNMR